MSRVFLRDCEPGDVVENVFVVTGKQFSTTTGGKPFIKVFVSDRSQTIPARMWNARRETFDAMPESGFVKIQGHLENYQNNLQLIIEQISPAAPKSIDPAELMPTTDRDIDEMCQRVFEICGSIQNRHVAAIVQIYLDDEELMNNFCRAPAAQSFHHAFVGGLLEHTLNMLEVADAVVKFYPGLNRDLMLAGIFLHDLAKTWELTYDCAFGYSDGGSLVGHIVKGAIWVEQKAREAEKILGEPIPPALVEVLQHLILSHHGEPEFGAARQPSTPEAIAIHYIDNLDAKLNVALSSRRQLSQGAGHWTEFLKAFGGRMYRPDVAPPEAIEAAKPGHNGQDATPTLKLSINNPLFESTPGKKK